MSRTILHVDLNNFYASAECLYNPSIRDKPVVVCGDVESRHGIVLAKNYLAKALGVKTGEAIWEAKNRAPGLVLVRADYQKYLRFSRLARAIYADYSDKIEPFGIDEAWIDITGTEKIFGTGLEIADLIRERLKNEIGLSGSVGVSFNKIFAKLGSDMNKPDKSTCITEDNFRDVVWPLPVGEMLYVGRSTRRKLESRAIYTIGDLANRDVSDLKLFLGVWGETLHTFANGCDREPVRLTGESSIIKSVGNSTTAVRDLMNTEDVKLIVYVLAESVAARLRKHGFKCRTVSISVRGSDLMSFDRQGKLSGPTFLSDDIASKAMELIHANYRWEKPIRSIGVRGTDLVTADSHLQLDLFDNRNMNAENLAFTVDDLQKRYGHYSIQRCSMLLDRKLTGFNPKDHVIHPVSFFR